VTFKIIHLFQVSKATFHSFSYCQDECRTVARSLCDSCASSRWQCSYVNKSSYKVLNAWLNLDSVNYLRQGDMPWRIGMHCFSVSSCIFYCALCYRAVVLSCPVCLTGPHLVQCGFDQGPPPCQVSSWSIQPFGTKTWAENWEGAPPPFWGWRAGSPSNTKSLRWGLAPYQVVSWCIQPFGHNRNGPKIGEGALPPFWGGGWVPI